MSPVLDQITAPLGGSAIIGALRSVKDALPAWTTHPAALIAWWIVGTVATVAFFLYPYQSLVCTFKTLPGPPRKSAFLGNSMESMTGEPGSQHKKWLDTYGKTVHLSGLGGRSALLTADVTTIGYILQHGYDFAKPSFAGNLLGPLLGWGLLIAEGADHRRQRRVVQPVFSPAHVKLMIPVFLNKSYVLAKMWNDLIDSKGDPAGDDGLKIDTLRFFNRLALDILGVAGMNNDFDSLRKSNNKLSNSYNDIIAAVHAMTPMLMMETFFPILRTLVVSDATRKPPSLTITAYGARKLVQEKKKRIANEKEGILAPTEVDKDILSLLIRNNSSAGVRDDQRLTDDEVLAQVTTLLFAGHETTSTGLGFLVERLANHPEVQQKLYEEVSQFPEDMPDFDQLNSLSYLDKVVHEVLRMDSPIMATIRVPNQDCVLPVGSPIVGTDGKLIESLRVKKGTSIFIEIGYVNKLPEVWGPDAHEFNPDRHDRPPLEKVPGVYGNVLSFLGGARNCIGYRFAVTEMKAATFVLARNFKFEPLPSKPPIKREWMVVQRPTVENESSYGPQMPLIVRKRHVHEL
ncbi:hypothetical protein VHUM_04169 [Vanrija humicola]|uniref:Cytochrome P450 n=1 Tax=Vanrija humicola TaxID=5417 RepID=A0A7D8UXZ1_VANHU|nr:hypothetical protein VHUM_04169 [Vanrija humicola]